MVSPRQLFGMEPQFAHLVKEIIVHQSGKFVGATVVGVYKFLAC